LRTAIYISCWAVFFALTMIVLPIACFWRPLRTRRWSLRHLLLLPAVIGIVLCVALMPLPSMWSVAERLAASLGALPGMAFVTLLIAYAVKKRWTRLIGWFATSVVGTLAFVAYWYLLIRPHEAGPLLSGERYAADGWFFVWLIGAYFTGVLAIVALPASALWTRVRRRRIYA
jgi:hypothetical protein